MTTFTKEELDAIRILVVRTRTNINLQKKTGLDIAKSMELVEKIDTLLKDLPCGQLDESQKDIYDISLDDEVMIITDTKNDVEYKIDVDLVHYGKVAAYLIHDRSQRIEDLEEMLYLSKSDADKYYIKEDIETLNESSEEYVLSYYSTNGIIAKDIDIKEFNKVCKEMIDSFTSYKNGESK